MDTAAMTLGAAKSVSRAAWPLGAWNGEDYWSREFRRLVIERGMYSCVGLRWANPAPITLRKDILDIFDKVSAALFQYRRQDRRDTQDLGCFRQVNNFVEQQNSIDVLHSRELKP
jgi:hypothetical protein